MEFDWKPLNTSKPLLAWQTRSYAGHGDSATPPRARIADHWRMATPRHLLVDPVNKCDYHLASRCVCRAWLVERLRQIAPCFAVDGYGYTVLSNHFHLVLRHDPLAGCGRSWPGASRRSATRRSGNGCR